MKTFILILFFGMTAGAKTTFSVAIASDAGKKIERVVAAELKKLYPLDVGSKNNLCFLMKNDEKSLTIFCRAYPAEAKGPKDKNYTTVSQHITCLTSEDTSLGITDAKTEQTIMLTVTCENEKT